MGFEERTSSGSYVRRREATLKFRFGRSFMIYTIEDFIKEASKVALFFVGLDRLKPQWLSRNIC